MARASRRLSARKVETVSKAGYHADGEGLYLVVDPSGARRWAFIYHTRGKRREMGLGRMGLKEARETAEEVRRQVRKCLRTGEVIGAKWTEIDLKRKIWVIPPERLKDRRTRTEPHRVPLSPVVVATLKALPRLGEFVFAGLKTGKPLSNMAMLSVLKDMNRDESGKPRWVDPKSSRPITPHGLRATFRTWGEDAGFPRDLLEESLGHQVGTAVERAYRRTDSFDRRRAIMQAWAKFCSGKRAHKVV